ncbi:TPA: ABC transporter permease, partial [Klebsiella variicola]
MPTYSPEQALARSTGRAPLWGEGLLAAALWLLGGLFTLAWPDAGRRWPFSEGWALAQFTLGGGLLLLALSYRYWRARGARVRHAGKWLALLPVLFAVWEGLTAKSAVLPVPFFAPPQALIEVLHDDWPRLLDSLLHSLGLL